MKFSNFLFPDCRDPERDGIVIDETLREARLSDQLGVDVIWLAEHHFDGICAYVDPITFAGALSTSTRHSKIGFAVVQTALHHPIRLAEQIAILDNITKGRLIVGLGRGSSYNIYDYQGFGIDHREAQARLEEAEEIIVKAWTGEDFQHQGRYWDLNVPMLRPRPYTKPHPLLIRAVSGEASLVELARHGRPFLMNVQSMAVTRQRGAYYRATMREVGFGEDRIASNLEKCWVWRNVFVAKPTPRPSASEFPPSTRWSSRGQHYAIASTAKPACESRCRRAICPPPAPASNTALFTAPRSGSPMRSQKSHRSALAV
jgi:hypothetical protein